MLKIVQLFIEKKKKKQNSIYILDPACGQTTNNLTFVGGEILSFKVIFGVVT